MNCAGEAGTIESRAEDRLPLPVSPQEPVGEFSALKSPDTWVERSRPGMDAFGAAGEDIVKARKAGASVAGAPLSAVSFAGTKGRCRCWRTRNPDRSDERQKDAQCSQGDPRTPEASGE